MFFAAIMRKIKVLGCPPLRVKKMVRCFLINPSNSLIIRGSARIQTLKLLLSPKTKKPARLRLVGLVTRIGLLYLIDFQKFVHFFDHFVDPNARNQRFFTYAHKIIHFTFFIEDLSLLQLQCS